MASALHGALSLSTCIPVYSQGSRSTAPAAVETSCIQSHARFFCARLDVSSLRALSPDVSCIGKFSKEHTVKPREAHRRQCGTHERLQISAEQKSLEETEQVRVLTSTGALGQIPAAPGVYAVYDKENTLQYMGLSRKVSTSVQVHADDLPELTHSVKVAVVDAPDRAALTDAWKAWMEQHIALAGKVPPGNESGNTTWTSKKVKRVKPELKLTPGAHVKLNVPISELLDKVVKECEVVAFIKGTRTAPQCGFSHRVLTILNEQRVDYETLNVLDEDHNPGLRDAIKAYSQWPTIPQLYVKGEFVGGADVLDEMVESGEIKALFGRK